MCRLGCPLLCAQGALRGREKLGVGREGGRGRAHGLTQFLSQHSALCSKTPGRSPLEPGLPGHSQQCFSKLNVLAECLEVLLKCRFCLSKSEGGPESLHF